MTMRAMYWRLICLVLRAIGLAIAATVTMPLIATWAWITSNPELLDDVQLRLEDRFHDIMAKFDAFEAELDAIADQERRRAAALDRFAERLKDHHDV